MILTSSRRLRSKGASNRGWELSRLAGRCYNVALDTLYAYYREHKITLAPSDLLKGMAKEDVAAFRALPAKLAQAAAAQAANDYYNALKARVAYEKDKSGFTGKPKMPRLGRTYGVLRISNQQFRIREGFVRFSPAVGLESMRLPSNIPKGAEVMAILLRPTYRSIYLDFAYETAPASKAERRAREKKWQKENELRQKDDSRGQRVIVDLNVNGVAMLDDTPQQSLTGTVINLRPLKARISLANRKLAELQSANHKHAQRAMLDHRSKLNRHTLHYLHCVANDVIGRAIMIGAAYILVGQNKGWKQRASMGKTGNRRFVSMPLAKMIELLRYKCRQHGLWLQTTEESYTSKVDHLALEPMEHRKAYLGRRVHRGLFRSSTGRVIHADLNGCIGIGRKVSGDSWLVQTIQSVTGKGARLAPTGIVVAHGLADMPRRVQATSEVKLAA